MNIALLLGGTSAERHVSMASASGIARALIASGHDLLLWDIALGRSGRVELDDLELPSLVAPTPEELTAFDNAAVVEAVISLPRDLDVAFLALHGAPGEDGTVQSILELCGIPYTGSGVLASALAMDKAMTKRIFEHYDVETPRWFSIRASEVVTASLARRVEEITDWPVVVKPNNGGSTVGLTILESAVGLTEACDLAGRYSDIILFEEYIAGREVTVAILGEESLPIVEIVPRSGIYDYANKYTAGRTDYICPADIPRDLEEEIRELGHRAHSALGCNGYSRVDFRLDADNVPYCLEVNTLPGMTATSLVPKAATAAGIDFAQLCERIIALALEPNSVET